MNASLRVLMGIATLAILIPAAAMVASNHQTTSSQASSPIDNDEIRRSTTLAAPTTVDGKSAKSTSTTNSGTATTSEHDHEDTPSSTVGTDTTEASATGGTITGEACPCTVTGTATLKGEVRLQGDLIVDGGTLIARSEVNVNGNGHQIMFMNGGRADFQGSKVFTWSDRGAKQNLQRDINFRNLRRIMWMANGGASTLKYFTVADSGSPNLGDYPLHWHLNGSSTRGTVVEGVVVIDGKNHAYVPHGSHGITFKDVIAKNTRNDAFWWDAPGTNDCSDRDKFCTADNSNDTTYDHVLVDGVNIPHGEQNHHAVAGFRLGAGSGNVVRNSVAINIKGGKNCSGFHWPSKANQNVGGNVWLFANNFSQSPDCHGIFVWQNDSNNHVISGFTGSGINHGSYGNNHVYRDFDVPYVNIHASGWRAHDGRAGTVVAHRHRQQRQPTAIFTNVEIDRFIVNNAGDEPGHYVLNNSGMSCTDVEYQAVEPESKVVIDGETCSIDG